MTTQYNEIAERAEYEEARLEHNVVAVGDGENPGNFAAYPVQPEWMDDETWNLYQARQDADEIPFDGSVTPSDDEPTSQIADSRDAAF